MDYLAYLERAWEYFPYVFYTFVFLTLLPKSIGRIKAFADADYQANRLKYHRCYAPDVCCHTLGSSSTAKPKQRKAVMRSYPKKHTESSLAAAPPEGGIVIKRQVPASAIQTHTHVNQIAKMFESGHASRKINRVTPTIQLQQDMETSAKKSCDLSRLLQENIENSANLLNQPQSSEHYAINDDCHWQSEPITIQRRKRHVPNTIMYAGTSATPSTASPVESSPLSSPPSSSSPLASPVQLRAPLNLNSSLEDIFAAIARSAEKSDTLSYKGYNSLSPVTSIDDILEQRRLSRPLSAYSISDLLAEENATGPSGLDEAYVGNLLRTLNKT